VRVKLAPRAQQRSQSVTTWLRKHRPGREEVFDREFDVVIDRLALMSPRGPLGTAQGSYRGKTLWRVLLPKSEQHLLYTIDEAKDLVVVRSVWGARRGSRPKL
jgi:plasmid stabilization system protein ParE